LRSPKRLFLGLFMLFTLLLMLVLGFLVYFIRNPEAPIFQYIFMFFFVVLGLLAVLLFLVLAFASFSLLRGTPPPGLNLLVNKTMVFLFPLILQLGKLLRIAQEKIQSSFVEVNNKLVDIKNVKVSPQKLLLLLPHCLQDENCPHKITQDPFNCQRCGKCPMDNLLGLAEKWQVNILVVTGGTLARRAIKSLRPSCVLAVACERDLSSGIVDSYPLPVWGVLNERPSGPCRNTRVSLDDLETKIQEILQY